MANKIPYKIYLDEDEMPKQWYNVRADMKNKPAPLLNPGTLAPVTLEELEHIWDEYQVYENDEIEPINDSLKIKYNDPEGL